MKMLMLLILPLTIVAAEVGQLPVGAYADTEVSIGTDADEDGNLSTCEAVCTFGYDCGRWFERSGARDDEQVTIAESFGRVVREFLLKRRNIDENWNLVKVTRRGGSAISEMTLIEGRKPGVSLMLR